MTSLAAIGAAGILALAAGRLGWLSTGGVGVAFPVGAAVLWGGGVRGGIMLGVFVVSSSLLTKWSERSGYFTDDSKGSRRDAAQVAANGFWVAAGAMLIPTHPVLGWSAVTGALAAAQADTWATEIGARSPSTPRLITTGQRVPGGTSGGITPLGSGAGVAGAAIMSLLGVVGHLSWPAVAFGLAGGTTGMFIDSLLGATVQIEYAAAAPATESRDRRVASPNPTGRGLGWCTNDVVNFACTATGAAVTTGLAWAWYLE